MSVPVALSVEPMGTSGADPVQPSRLFRVLVEQHSAKYKVRLLVRAGSSLVLGTLTETGRQPTGNRRADIERCAIDAVQL